MKHLTKLSPAETLYVLQNKNASIKEILKITFMDLILKQVLRTFEVKRQANIREEIRYYKYIGIGNNFLLYKPLPHENIFLAPFQKSNNIQILFRNMVKIGYQNAKSKSSLHNILRISPSLQICYSQNIIQSLFGTHNITNEGKELKKNLEEEISLLENQLPNLILNNHQKALDVLKVIKGNIFLLKNIEFNTLNQIDKEFLTEMNKSDEKSKNDNGCSGCTWHSFDNYSESFDSSCSGDSGCSSGCSGCSGCVGCGGD